IVVTEISTPTSAPDFAAVSDSTPAEPATNATKKLSSSGSEMNRVKSWSTSTNSLGKRPSAMNTSDVNNVHTIPRGKPTVSARSERRASCGCLLTKATLTPASGPNSGPTTIAPTIRIGWSAGRCLLRCLRRVRDRRFDVLDGDRPDPRDVELL